jgi:hypothetical protein
MGSAMLLAPMQRRLYPSYRYGRVIIENLLRRLLIDFSEKLNHFSKREFAQCLQKLFNFTLLKF